MGRPHHSGGPGFTRYDSRFHIEQEIKMRAQESLEGPEDPFNSWYEPGAGGRPGMPGSNPNGRRRI